VTCTVSLRTLLTCELVKRESLGAVYKMRPHSVGRWFCPLQTFFGQGGGRVLQMHKFVLFGAKNSDFLKFMLCPHGQDGREINWTAPCFFDFLPVNLLLVRSHLVEIIIVKRLIQATTCTMRVGVEPRSHDRDHSRFNSLGCAAGQFAQY